MKLRLFFLQILIIDPFPLVESGTLPLSQIVGSEYGHIWPKSMYEIIAITYLLTIIMQYERIINFHVCVC